MAQQAAQEINLVNPQKISSIIEHASRLHHNNTSLTIDQILADIKSKITKYAETWTVKIEGYDFNKYNIQDIGDVFGIVKAMLEADSGLIDTAYTPPLPTAQVYYTSYYNPSSVDDTACAGHTVEWGHQKD